MTNYNDFIVDIKQLRSNIINIRALCGWDVRYCAIVKANAYGLGAMHVCQNITDLVDFFAVATFKEAVQIREVDADTRILVLGAVDIENIQICSDLNISISIGNYAQLNKIADRLSGKIHIHLQVNTGLNRYGFRSTIEFKKALHLIELSENMVLEGVYSHFATKQNDINFINKQYYKFIQYKNYVKNKDIIFHIANSFATIYDNRLRLQMVRTGMLMYGGIDGGLGNEPVLSIKSHIININNIKKGDSVGYDRTFVAKKKMIIAIVPMGYADGLDRRLSNKFCLLVNGKKCRIIGNICMDVCMIDITDVGAQLGDEVVILGKQGTNGISLQDYASVLNTSIYDVLLKFNYRRMNYVLVK